MLTTKPVKIESWERSLSLKTVSARFAKRAWLFVRSDLFSPSFACRYKYISKEDTGAAAHDHEWVLKVAVKAMLSEWPSSFFSMFSQSQI